MKSLLAPFLAIATLSFSPGVFADEKRPSTQDGTEFDAADEVDVEVRTLKSGSALRALLEQRLGPRRVAADFTLKIRTAADIEDAYSRIDELEASIRSKTILDPVGDPIEPNGPGSRRGQTQSTHANCINLRGAGGQTQLGNVSWHWVWTPDTDTNGDGRVNNSDQCPCSWVLQNTDIEWHTESGALEC